MRDSTGEPIPLRAGRGRLLGVGLISLTMGTAGFSATASLAAEENYWGGRPFLDAIEIELGKNYRDQLVALELGKADLVEVAPEQSRRVSTEGRRVISSAPVELSQIDEINV